MALSCAIGCVKLNKKAAAGAPQPKTTTGKDLGTVNRRTTIRQRTSIDWRNEEFDGAKHAHAVRSFL
jgi:hypothetical protein